MDAAELTGQAALDRRGLFSGGDQRQVVWVVPQILREKLAMLEPGEIGSIEFTTAWWLEHNKGTAHDTSDQPLN